MYDKNFDINNSKAFRVLECIYEIGIKFSLKN